jgi:hypothetical protein
MSGVCFLYLPNYESKHDANTRLRVEAYTRICALYTIYLQQRRKMQFSQRLEEIKEDCKMQ